MNGWIKIHRTMLEWEHFGEPSVVTVFLALMLSADNDGVTDISLRGIASLTKLTANTIRCALAKLVGSGEISRAVKIGSKTTTTINNWKRYQVYQKLTHQDNVSVSKIDTLPCQKLTQSVSKIDTHNKNNKNKDNNKIVVADNARACVREDFIAEAMTDSRIEQGCIALRISADQYKQLVYDVINDWQFSDLADNEWTLTHLLSAMRIKNNINKRDNGQRTTEGRNGRSNTVTGFKICNRQ